MLRRNPRLIHPNPMVEVSSLTWGHKDQQDHLVGADLPLGHVNLTYSIQTKNDRIQPPNNCWLCWLSIFLMFSPPILSFLIGDAYSKQCWLVDINRLTKFHEISQKFPNKKDRGTTPKRMMFCCHTILTVISCFRAYASRSDKQVYPDFAMLCWQSA